MNVKSLYDQCVEFVSEHVSTFHTYSDIINNFWGEIPKSCLNDILTEHVKNCRALDINYISVYPTDANSYISRICYDCHSVIEEPSFVSLRIHIQKSEVERIKTDYECEQCGDTLVSNIDPSCECI